jgi:peptide/nickel transport system substrate-binding protein
VRSVEVVGDLTVRIHTVSPTPLLQDQIGRIYIVPAHLGRSVATVDFDPGHAMIGTGPYRFVSASPGDDVVMTSNPYYWGTMPQFHRVTLKFIADPASRTAALLAKRVDVIEEVSPGDMRMLRTRAGIRMFSTIAPRMTDRGTDSARDHRPPVT